MNGRNFHDLKMVMTESWFESYLSKLVPLCLDLDSIAKNKIRLELKLSECKFGRSHSEVVKNLAIHLISWYSLRASSAGLNLIHGLKYVQFKSDSLHGLDARHVPLKVYGKLNETITAYYCCFSFYIFFYFLEIISHKSF